MAEAKEWRGESWGGNRLTWLAFGVVGLIALAAAAYAALSGAQTASSTGAEPGVAAPDVTMQTVVIPVEGMTCGACVARIKRTLKAIAGVGSVEASLERREVLVRYEADRVTAERLVAEIDELGYKATVREATEPGKPTSETATHAEAAISESATKAVTIPVQGMACESCVRTVEGLLRALPGVEDARVSLEQEEARVRYAEGEVTPERLAEEISAQGFEAGPPSTERTK